MMRFAKPRCPECGEVAKGTVDRVPGVALLDFDEEGNARWAGETEIDWDGQSTGRDDCGRVLLTCHHGTEWFSAMEEYPDVRAAYTQMQTQGCPKCSGENTHDATRISDEIEVPVRSCDDCKHFELKYEPVAEPPGAKEAAADHEDLRRHDALGLND